MKSVRMPQIARRWPALLLVGVLIGVLAGPASAATADEVSGEARVVVSGPVVVPAGERSNTIVAFEGPVEVAGEVAGSVVAFEGPVRVTGRVSDSVIALGGRVEIGEGARVGGDVSSPFTPVVAPGATVDGEVTRFDIDTLAAPLRGTAWVAFSLSLLALGLLMLLLAPRGLDRALAAARERPGVTAAWGIALFFGLPIIAVLAMALVIGLPFGLDLLLALGPIYAIGYMAGAYMVGRLVVKPPRSSVLALLAGWGIVQVVSPIPVLGGLVGLIAMVGGLGGIAVATLQTRSAAAAPAPGRATAPA